MAPSSFCYPATQAYVIHMNRVRAARRRRRSCPSRWIFGSIGILFFATVLAGSLWLLFSFYALDYVEMGRNYSHLYRANTLFVRDIVVTNRFQNEGPVIYGFSKPPELNQEVNWIEAHDAIIPSNEHQEWAIWLNRGSQVAIQYNISDPSFELLLVVIQGKENMQKWIEDPTSPDPISSGKVAQGAGTLQYQVERDHTYYLGLGNLNSSDVQVNLQFTFNSKVHNRENFTSQCYLTSSTCSVHLKLFGSDILLLTSPPVTQFTEGARLLQQDNNTWSVGIAFEQRWITYLIFWGAMAVVMLILLVFCRPSHETETSQESQDPLIEATPPTSATGEEEKLVTNEFSETSSSNMPADFDQEAGELMEDYMCIICFEGYRNCFFDPCGHCATCYSCSMKILKQKKANCPLCRQPIRFVRKLFLR